MTIDNTAKTEVLAQANDHWDWLAPIIKYIPVSSRDDLLIRYIFTTAFTHGAKHEAERNQSEQ